MRFAFSLRTPKDRQTAIYLPLSGAIQRITQCSAKQHHNHKGYKCYCEQNRKNMKKLQPCSKVKPSVSYRENICYYAQYSLTRQLFTFALMPFLLSQSIKMSLIPVTDITFPMLATDMQGQRWSSRKCSITSITLKLHPILMKQQMLVQSFDSRKRLFAQSTLLSFCVSANMMIHLSPRHGIQYTQK